MWRCDEAILPLHISWWGHEFTLPEPNEQLEMSWEWLTLRNQEFKSRTFGLKSKRLPSFCENFEQLANPRGRAPKLSDSSGKFVFHLIAN